MSLERCYCGAIDCRFCHPRSYKSNLAWLKGEVEDPEDHEEPEEDEDITRYREEGRER